MGSLPRRPVAILSSERGLGLSRVSPWGLMTSRRGVSGGRPRWVAMAGTSNQVHDLRAAEWSEWRGASGR